MSVAWLSRPAGSRVGSHAFAPGADRSACELASRAAAVGPETPGGRRCAVCEGVLADTREVPLGPRTARRLSTAAARLGVSPRQLVETWVATLGCAGASGGHDEDE